MRTTAQNLHHSQGTALAARFEEVVFKARSFISLRFVCYYSHGCGLIACLTSFCLTVDGSLAGGTIGGREYKGHAIAFKRIESYTSSCGYMAGTADRDFIQAMVGKVYPLLMATCYFWKGNSP